MNRYELPEDEGLGVASDVFRSTLSLKGIHSIPALRKALRAQGACGLSAVLFTRSDWRLASGGTRRCAYSLGHPMRAHFSSLVARIGRLPCVHTSL